MRVFLKLLGGTLLAISLLLEINVGHAEQVHSAVSQSETVYKIDSKTHRKYPALIQLMLNTESLNDYERQSWFNQIPSMSKAQINYLYNILEREKKNLDALNAEKKRRADIKISNGMH